MTSQGTAPGRYERAIARGDLLAAEMAARELGHLSLADALALTVLIGRCDPARYERAAVRWHGRFELEARGVTLAESHLALAALATSPADGSAGARALHELGRRHRLALERALRG